MFSIVSFGCYQNFQRNMFKNEKVNGNNFQTIPDPCRFCLYWQTTGPFNKDVLQPIMAEKKQKWFNEMAKVFGTCMKVAYCNGIPIGFMQFAPAKCFLKVKEYASEPPSNDTVFLACLYITDNKYRGKGLGKNARFCRATQK